jgi:late embryogenesis abundant protein
MTRTGWCRAAWFGLLTACTPVGLWLYEDPVVTVAGIRLNLEASRPSGSSPLIVALAVKNSNDYPLSTEQVELSLRLDGVAIGRLKRDSPAEVATDAVSTVAIALALGDPATQEDLKVFGSGTHNYAVRGRATFRTPIGVRKVRFAQEGAMVFEHAPVDPAGLQ